MGGVIHHTRVFTVGAVRGLKGSAPLLGRIGKSCSRQCAFLTTNYVFKNNAVVSKQLQAHVAPLFYSRGSKNNSFLIEAATPATCSHELTTPCTYRRDDASSSGTVEQPTSNLEQTKAMFIRFGKRGRREWTAGMGFCMHDCPCPTTNTRTHTRAHQCRPCANKQRHRSLRRMYRVRRV